jgi:5-deoxy-glucuronate isomerase
MSTVKIPSRRLTADESGVLVEVTPDRAGWEFVSFAARQIAAGSAWSSTTGADEVCLVLLQGQCQARWGGGAHRLGPRADVFSEYPHAVYLPPRTDFRVDAEAPTQVAECRAPATERHDARGIEPGDCGFEIRGGGNATRQIIDIMPPTFPAHRLMVCEVYTPGGNWSSYPPHKHDTDAPPREVDLDETYYYRFRDPHAYGIQRLYSPDEEDDQALTVRDGDLVLIRSGYHPFVSAHGYDAYYLNALAGDRRSMAASDDPALAWVRSSWEAMEKDPRVPIVRR